MHKNHLTALQEYYLLALFFTGGISMVGIVRSARDGWIVFLLLAVVSLPVLWLFSQLSGGTWVGARYEAIVGKPAAAVLMIGYCIVAVCIAGGNLQMFSHYAIFTSLQGTNEWSSVVLMSAAVLALLLQEVEGLGRTAWILQPVTAVLLALSVLVSLRRMDVQNLLPLAPQGGGSVLDGLYTAGALILLPAVFPVMLVGCKSTWGKKTGIYAAAIYAFVVMALMNARDEALLGGGVMEELQFPSYSALSVLCSGGRVLHFEMLFSIAYVLGQPFRAALYLQFVQQCLCHWQPRWKNWYPYLLSGGALLLALSGLLRAQVQTPEKYRLAAVLLFFALPLAVWVVGRLRRRS